MTRFNKASDFRWFISVAVVQQWDHYSKAHLSVSEASITQETSTHIFYSITNHDSEKASVSEIKGRSVLN